MGEQRRRRRLPRPPRVEKTVRLAPEVAEAALDYAYDVKRQTLQEYIASLIENDLRANGAHPEMAARGVRAS